MESTNWAPAHSDALRKHFALGMSYAEIARAINAEFNTNYSRCAAIGRAKRLGLGAINRPGEATEVVPKAQSSSLHKLGKRLDAMSKWFVPFFERVEMPKLRCVEIDPRHLSLLELEAGDCRYPYGGEEEGEAITFCGHPKRKGSNYCTAHFHLTRNPDAVPERAISTAALRVVEAA
ncbi:MAG TPA: GcrA family cell cycle regulator [Bradyrhizobium sp.]|jgi:GcrA cell cycle regulator